MKHERVVNVVRGAVVCSCTCEGWSVTFLPLTLRTIVLELVTEAHNEHLATISAEPPSEQREQERGVAVASSPPSPDHHKEGTPAVHAEVPVTGSRTGSEAR
jgi:hypothetical protein